MQNGPATFCRSLLVADILLPKRVSPMRACLDQALVAQGALVCGGYDHGIDAVDVRHAVSCVPAAGGQSIVNLFNSSIDFRTHTQERHDLESVKECAPCTILQCFCCQASSTGIIHICATEHSRCYRTRQERLVDERLDICMVLFYFVEVDRYLAARSVWVSFPHQDAKIVFKNPVRVLHAIICTGAQFSLRV